MQHMHFPQKEMTRPSNFAHTNGDFDLQAMLGSEDFQSAINNPSGPSFFQVFAEYLQRNYNIRIEEEDFNDSDSDESIELNPINAAEEAYADRLMQAIVNGQREVPMRRILPVTPPPSPTPNPAVMRFPSIPPPLPPRRRSQLSTMTTSEMARRGHFADLNGAEEMKSPQGGYEVLLSPLDKNNELPYTREYQLRLLQRRGADMPGR